MNSSNVQRVYEEHVAVLSAAERLRLVELITRNLAAPEEPAAVVSADGALSPNGTWQPMDHRGDLTEWRDRVL